MDRSHALLLSAVLVLSALLNLWHVDFPLGYHIDEPVKVDFIKRGTQNFLHPILMLQVARLANVATGFEDDQHVVVLGRSLMALYATFTVFVSYCFARRVIPPGSALVVAAAVAVAPTLVVHAHYLKEDTILTLWLMASLLAFLRFVDRVGVQSSTALGISVGLACSSHYKGVLLLALFLTAPLLNMGRTLVGGRLAFDRRYYVHLLLAGLIAGSVFLVVNWPLVHDVPGFLAGAGAEARHAIEGEDARLRVTDTWFGFHLIHSLAPGMTWPALTVGLIGLTWTVVRWRHAEFQDRILAAYAFVFYLVPEISPLKPAPDFSRYMVPVVPALIYLAWRMVDDVSCRLPHVGRRTLLTAAAVALVALPLYSTARLTSSMGHDTRARAADWLRQHAGKAIVEQYAGLKPDTWTAADLDLTRARADGVSYVAMSSFMYDRYFLGSRLPNQEAEIYRIHDRYVDLFAHPYVEIDPPYLSFGFNNPVIRIIDIRPGR